MDVLNRWLGGAGEAVKSMSPGARVLAAGALALVVTSVAWMVNQRTNGPDTYLMGGEVFSATQLRNMQSAFGKAGLEDYEIDRDKVRVPRGQQSKYMAALADEGALPEDFGEYLKKAVNSSGFMLYGAQQEAQTKVAIQSELQLVISRMQGIEKAFVHIAEETSRGFPQRKTVTASVGIEPRGEAEIDDATVAAIRSFVASAWGGLKPEAVTVVDLGDNRLFAGSGGDAKAPTPASEYASHKKQLEVDWQAKIARVLAIPGALVTANVELDREGRRASEVSISVAVPQAYYEKLWRKRRGGAAAGSPEQARWAAFQETEQRKIEAAVVPLLGAVERTGGRACRVAVSTIQAPAATPSVAPDPKQPALAWLAQHWQQLSMGGLILVGLLVLHSTLKTSSAPAPTIDLPSAITVDVQPSVAPYAAARPLAISSEALREDLALAVRKDPQAAANVIRSWMGSVS